MPQTNPELQVPTAKRNGKKIKGKFYPLSPSYTQKLREAKLTAKEWAVWSYLISVDPWGDKYQDLNPLTVMAECDCSKSTFYRAIAKLQDLKLFDFQDKGFCFKNEMGAERLREGYRKNETEFPKMRPPVSKMRQESQKWENQPPEPAPSADRRTPQTIQTFETLQTGVGVENSPPTESELINKESDGTQQDSYSEVATVREEEIVDLKDPREEDSSADVAQITTKRVTMTVNSHSLPVTSEEHLTATDEQSKTNNSFIQTRNENEKTLVTERQRVTGDCSLVTEEGRPYQATEIIDVQYSEEESND